MFNNIGRKIKGLAKFLFWVVVIAGIIGGFLIMIAGLGSSGSSTGEKIGAFVGGLLVIGLSVLFAWLQNFLLYGYGELIDCSQKMLRILEQDSMSSSVGTATVVRQEEYIPPQQPVQTPTSLQSIANSEPNQDIPEQK